MVRKDANAERGKYSKVGDPKQIRPTSTIGSRIRKCFNRFMVCSISTMVILCILAIVGYSSPEYGDENLRNGQASEHGVKALVPYVSDDGLENVDSPKGRLDDYSDDEYKFTDEDVNEAVEEVGTKVQLAAEEEVEMNEDSILKSAVTTFGQYVRIGISKMFDELSARDIEQMAQEIEQDVLKEIDEEYKEIANEIVQDEMIDIENMVDAEESMGNELIDVEFDVYNSQEQKVDDVIKEIDEAATEVANAMKINTAQIEKEVLEKKLSEKLGQKVELVFNTDDNDDDDDDIDGTNDDDEDIKMDNMLAALKATKEDKNQVLEIPLPSRVGKKDKKKKNPPPLPPGPPPP